LDYEESAEFDKFDCSDTPNLDFLLPDITPCSERENALNAGAAAQVELQKKVSGQGSSAGVFV
jgi:hypothetical protein